MGKRERGREGHFVNLVVVSMNFLRKFYSDIDKEVTEKRRGELRAES